MTNRLNSSLQARSSVRNCFMFCTALALASVSLPALAGPFIYASSRSYDTVTVIDRGTQAVVAIVPVGDEPRGMAVHPDGSEVYVATNDGLTIIDAATFQTTDVPLECAGGSGVVVAPSGNSVLVGHRDCSFVSRVVLSNLSTSTIGVVGSSYRIASGPLGDFVYTISRTGAISQASWASLSFSQMMLGGAPISGVANKADGMVVDSYGSVWISQSSDPGKAVQALAISPGSGAPLLLATAKSGVTVDGLGITSTFGGVGQTVLAANTTGRRIERIFASPISLGSAEPLAVAGGWSGEMATGNDNDVTGQGMPNDGSVSVLDGGPMWAALAGRNPEHVVFGPDNGADLNCSPNPLEFIYTKIGRTYTGSIVVRSTGVDPLKLGTLKVVGANAADFSIASDGCSGKKIAVGSSCTVVIKFTPSSGAGNNTTILGSTMLFQYRGYAADLEIPSNAAGPFVRTNALIGTHISFSIFRLEIIDKYGQMLLVRSKGGD